jgi:hypothetical protein
LPEVEGGLEVGIAGAEAEPKVRAARTAARTAAVSARRGRTYVLICSPGEGGGCC